MCARKYLRASGSRNDTCGEKRHRWYWTLGFRHRDLSPRWKEIVEPAPGRFAHHLELYAARDIDAEVKDWLRAAWEAAA